MTVSTRRLLIGAVVAAVACTDGTTTPPTPATAERVSIKGTLQLLTETEYGGLGITLPDLEVEATNLADATITAKDMTDVDGHFELKDLPSGDYDLCWSGPGWTSDCAPGPVTVASFNRVMKDLYVQPVSRPVFGQIRLMDRTLCAYRDGEATPGDIAQVQGRDAADAPVGPLIRTNRQGFYAFGDGASIASVEAFCDGPDGAAAVQQAGLATDVFVNDRAPVMVAFGAFANGRRVKRVSPGDTVVLEATAQDPDGDPVVAEWRVNGEVLPAASPLTAQFTPSVAGTYAVDVTVSNDSAPGRGARAEGSFMLRSSAEASLRFGGTVVASDGLPLSNLRVTIDGQTVATGADGRFFAEIPEDPDMRYVIDARAEGYVPVSEVLDEESLGLFYTLQAGSRITFSAGEPITHRDERGFSVALPPDLVDSNGNLVQGQVTATIGFIDPTDESMPADYEATTDDGDAFLSSYGAAYVDLRDANGNEVELGEPARLTFPIPTGLLNPPPTFPIWSYDEEAGQWYTEGVEAVLVNNRYEADVEHFSFVNMDIANEAAACIRIKPVYQQLPSPTPRLRVSADQGDGTFKTKILDLTDPVHAAVRLLPNRDVKFEVIGQNNQAFADLRLTDDLGNPLGSTTVTATGDYTPNYVPGTWTGELWPPAPYTDCEKTIVLTSADPAYANPYNKGFLAIEGAAAVIDKDCTGGTCDAGAIEALAYYELVDPDERRDTLGKWWEANGFDDETGLAPGDATFREAAYLNAGDLGSGRNMRCRHDADRVACYVGNYGNFDLQPGSADIAAAAKQEDAFATVCMEYAPVEDVDNPDTFVDLNNDGDIDDDDKIVKFFVYPGGTPDSDRIISARLDNTYERYNPRICMTCHGGELPSEIGSLSIGGNDLPDFSGVNRVDALKKMHEDLSVFREFDVGTFGPPTGGLDLAALAEFNCDTVKQTPLPPAVTGLIDTWYTCNANPPTFQEQTVPGWTNGDPLYDDFVAKACRACHVAQEGDYGGDNDNDFDLADSSDFSEMEPVIQALACSAYTMPHAEVTFNKFWFQLDPINQGPALLNPACNFVQ